MSPSADPSAAGAGDLLRPGLRKALATFARTAPGVTGEGVPPASAPAGAGPILTWEETFTAAEGGFPEDLFGGEFSWEEDDRDGGRIVFWDLETCGLADAPIFLMGALWAEGGALRLRRTLARDPSGEPALLRNAASLLRGAAAWVTFNGRSFDAPRIRRRAALFGIEIPPPAEHHDLLLAVRRRWRAKLPDCRLSTVERRLLGLFRGPGDIPGREVPERYRDYVLSGKLEWLSPVLLHNRRDVAAMAVLYRRLRAEGEFGR